MNRDRPYLANPAGATAGARKIGGHPGSLVLLAIEPAEACCNFCRVTFAWLSVDERKALRRALEVCRRKRQSRLKAHSKRFRIVSAIPRNLSTLPKLVFPKPPATILEWVQGRRKPNKICVRCHHAEKYSEPATRKRSCRQQIC